MHHDFISRQPQSRSAVLRLAIFPAFAPIILVFLLALIFCRPAAAEPVPAPIVGGVEAVPGAWPFQAAIMDASLFQYCGGSLISAGWVLTAGHCVTDDDGTVTPASQIRVGMGLHRLSTGGGSIHGVSRVIVHPSFNTTSLNFDFALLELSSAASQAPVVLNFSSASLTGLEAIVTGWGTTISGAASSSDVLRQVSLPIVSNSVCSSVVSGITANMLCAGLAAGGRDSCQGDSGGPLFLVNGSTVKQVGVVSFGNGCGDPNSYGVYSRVEKAAAFIQQYVPIQPLTTVSGKYGLWNGFLGMVNIIELINRSSQATTAQVNLFAIDGTLVSSNIFAVGGSSQQDVIINSLPGFRADFYGIIQVSNNVEGRILYYRPTDTAFLNFDFVFGVPLSDPISGTSRVGFNTYQPSFNSFDQGLLVANWLSIVNLSGAAQSYTITKYDSGGNQLSQQIQSVASKSRLDTDGGHTNPGPSNVGLIEIVPADSSAPYLAQLMRYGYGSGGHFEFAFPLIAKPGSTAPQAVTLGSPYLAQNWLEVVNAGSGSNSVAVNFYDAGGSPAGSTVLDLPAHSQSHLNVNSILGDRAIGAAVIASQSSQPVVAESMFYYRADSGSISSMYGSQARGANGSSAVGTFNLFLGMENYLKISNPNSSAVNADVSILSLFSGGSSQTIPVPAHSSVELSLHNTAAYGTASDSYGTVTVQPSSPSLPLIHEILRLKRSAGEVQFTAPTVLE